MWPKVYILLLLAASVLAVLVILYHTGHIKADSTNSVANQSKQEDLELFSDENEFVKGLLTKVLTDGNVSNNIVGIHNISLAAYHGFANTGSNATRVNFTAVTGSGLTRKGGVVLMGYPTTEFRKELISKTGIFDKEKAVYEDILPALENLEIEIDDESERMWLKYYGTVDNIVIVEDIMRDGNYTLPNPREGLNLKHAELAIVTLAKFHAMSAVLAERGKIPFEKFDQSLFQANKERINDFYEIYLNNFADSIGTTWGPEWAAYAEKIREKAKTITEYLVQVYKRDDTAFNVLCYGSYTITNMLFRYGISDVYTSDDPISMKLDGYTTLFYNSPAFDIQQFINSSPNPRVIVDHKDDLVNVYYGALLRYLDKFNFNGKIPTLDDLQREIKRTDLYGFTNAIVQLSYNYIPPEDTPNIEEVVQKSWEINKVLVDSRGVFQSKFISTMKELIQKATNENLI